MTNVSPTQKILSDKSYFVNSLKNLKDKIESISIFHQTKILSIFYENNIPINENKNGVFLKTVLVFKTSYSFKIKGFWIKLLLSLYILYIY